MDCQSIRASSESLDSLRHACESQSGQVNLKVRQIDSGWIVTDSDDQPVSPNGSEIFIFFKRSYRDNEVTSARTTAINAQ